MQRCGRTGWQSRVEKGPDNAANAEPLQRTRAEATALRDEVNRLEEQLAVAQDDVTRTREESRAIHEELQRHVAVNHMLEQTTRELQTKQLQKGACACVRLCTFVCEFF